MTMADTAQMHTQVQGLFRRKQIVAFAVPVLLLAYLIYIFFAFDIGGVAQRARLDNAVTLASDSWSYKTHVTRSHRTDEFKVAIEGERKGTYPADMIPNWIAVSDAETVIDLGDGHVVTYLPDNAMTYVIPGWGTFEAQFDGSQVVTNVGDDAPEWMNISRNRVALETTHGRLSMTRSKTEVFRYFGGWELFFYTIDSPYFEHSFADIMFGEQIDPTRSNIVGAWQDFWGNKMWRHADVAWALSETILMAFLGTFGGALVALPLAFLAAKNFTPILAVRFAIRRVFDFVRGVDALIWTIVLSRAFGLGPMTGALAILITDTGSFGKMFSEALENVDEKQIEGVQSTGAKPLQRYRFGVIPQVTPVLLSQILYFFESNTRGATIIGAITGGGIGLMLTQAIQTQKDWEEVAYYIILIVLLVMMMDSLSGWLRRKLIHGGEGGH